MYYFALLLTPERQLDADEGAREMQAYQDFHARAASAIRAGDALGPAAAGVRISGGCAGASPACPMPCRAAMRHPAVARPCG